MSTQTESSIESSPTYQPTLGVHEHGLCNLNKWGLTEDDYERFRSFADELGQKPEAIRPRPHGRDETDPALEEIVRAAREHYPNDVVHSAVPRMLDALSAKIVKERREPGPSKGTGMTALRPIAKGMMLKECKQVLQDRASVAERTSHQRKPARTQQRSLRRSIDDLGAELVQEALAAGEDQE